MHRNLVEISGISELIPSNIKDFKYVYTSRILNLPTDRPEIKRILRLTAKAIVNSKKVVYTPKSQSKDGQILTGIKLIVQGNLMLSLEYLPDSRSGFPITIDFTNPFTTYIVLNEDFDCNSDIVIDIYVQNFYFKHVSKRIIATNTLLLVNAAAQTS